MGIGRGERATHSRRGTSRSGGFRTHIRHRRDGLDPSVIQKMQLAHARNVSMPQPSDSDFDLVDQTCTKVYPSCEAMEGPIPRVQIRTMMTSRSARVLGFPAPPLHSIYQKLTPKSGNLFPSFTHPSIHSSLVITLSPSLSKISITILMISSFLPSSISLAVSSSKPYVRRISRPVQTPWFS